jgi:hypothetical protein
MLMNTEDYVWINARQVGDTIVAGHWRRRQPSELERLREQAKKEQRELGMDS